MGDIPAPLALGEHGLIRQTVPTQPAPFMPTEQVPAQRQAGTLQEARDHRRPFTYSAPFRLNTTAAA